MEESQSLGGDDYEKMLLEKEQAELEQAMAMSMEVTK